MSPATQTRPSGQGAGNERLENFVGRFAAYWSNPDVERLGELLSEDVRLV